MCGFVDICFVFFKQLGDQPIMSSLYPIEDPALRNLAIFALAVLRTNHHHLYITRYI